MGSFRTGVFDWSDPERDHVEKARLIGLLEYSEYVVRTGMSRTILLTADMYNCSDAMGNGPGSDASFALSVGFHLQSIRKKMISGSGQLSYLAIFNDLIVHGAVP
eukprot:scpid107638/ scgid7622/ 